MNTQGENTTNPIEITPYYEEGFNFEHFELECDKGHMLFEHIGMVNSHYEDLLESDLDSYLDDLPDYISEFLNEHINNSYNMGDWLSNYLQNKGEIRTEMWLDHIADEDPELYKKLEEEEQPIKVFGDVYEYVEYKDWIIVVNTRC